VVVRTAMPAIGLPACPPQVGQLSDEERASLAEQFGFRSIGKVGAACCAAPPAGGAFAAC
jgi:hypothetical protein